GALDTRDRVAFLIGEHDASGDSIGAVLGHLDRRLANSDIDILPRFATVDGETQSSPRTGAHGADQLVHPGAARADEWVTPGVKRRGHQICAETGVRTDTSVVKDRDLLADVGGAPVRHPCRVLRAAEPDSSVGAVAQRL